ncbi:MAG: DUF2927 domain-containing protein [Bacteroidota bacterium]
MIQSNGSLSRLGFSMSKCLLFLVFLVSCQKEELTVDCSPFDPSFIPNDIQMLFLDLAFDQEFGRSTERLRKWNQKINVFIDGTAELEVMNEIDLVLSELNTLSTSVLIEKIRDKQAANLQIFLGTKEEYVSLVEPRAAGIAEGNSGFATIAWNDQHEIVAASVCIDVIQFSGIEHFQHVIREELAQVLGLINDTELLEESIFHQFNSSSTSYSETDKMFIAYMLGNELQPGMCEREVVEIVN